MGPYGHKVQNIYYLAIYRRTLPTPVLDIYTQILKNILDPSLTLGLLCPTSNVSAKLMGICSKIDESNHSHGRLATALVRTTAITYLEYSSSLPTGHSASTLQSILNKADPTHLLKTPQQSK